MKHPKKMDSLGNFNDTNLDFTYQPFNTFQNGMLNYYKKRRKEVLDCIREIVVQQVKIIAFLQLLSL